MVKQFCPWFLKQGTIELDEWVRIGRDFKRAYKDGAVTGAVGGCCWGDDGWGRGGPRPPFRAKGGQRGPGAHPFTAGPSASAIPWPRGSPQAGPRPQASAAAADTSERPRELGRRREAASTSSAGLQEQAGRRRAQSRRAVGETSAAERPRVLPARAQVAVAVLLWLTHLAQQPGCLPHLLHPPTALAECPFGRRCSPSGLGV